VLLLVGIVIGGGGVLFVQQRYLPPRLSAEASAALRSSFEQADAERLRLGRELAATTSKLEATLASNKGLADELASTRRSAQRLREDVVSLASSLPPDPRGGTVQVRAARLSAEGGRLLYDVVLSRERAAGKPLSGVLQLVVAGAGKRGSPTTVKLEPVAISVGLVESVRGGAPLPDGFDARQATINVLDRPDGRLLGMRVMLVK
ncbi:MAG TPA: hypothetical protein VJ743_15655, partial [Albitalea sp.]|nr:hypothetical protein [Albitalea sp.]